MNVGKPHKVDPDIPLIEQLIFVPTDFTPICNDPITPEIIAIRSKEIRDTWDEETFFIRSTGRRCELETRVVTTSALMTRKEIE